MPARPQAMAYQAPATPSLTAYWVVPMTTPEPMLAPIAEAMMNQMLDWPEAVRKSLVVLAWERPRKPIATLIAIKITNVIMIKVVRSILFSPLSFKCERACYIS